MSEQASEVDAPMCCLSLGFQMEKLIRRMQDGSGGVSVRSQKQFLVTIPDAFTGKIATATAAAAAAGCAVIGGQG